MSGREASPAQRQTNRDPTMSTGKDSRKYTWDGYITHQPTPPHRSNSAQRVNLPTAPSARTVVLTTFLSNGEPPPIDGTQREPTRDTTPHGQRAPHPQPNVPHNHTPLLHTQAAASHTHASATMASRTKDGLQTATPSLDADPQATLLHTSSPAPHATASATMTSRTKDGLQTATSSLDADPQATLLHTSSPSPCATPHAPHQPTTH